MEIEVRQDDGSYAKAFVQLIEKENISVTYPNTWKPDETVVYDRIRAILTDKDPKKDFKNGETLEAYYKKAGQEVERWQTVRMRDIKGEFLAFEDASDSSVTGVVQLEFCRPKDSAKPIRYEMFHHFEVSVPQELKTYFEDSKKYADFTDSIKNIHITFDSDKLILNFASLISSAIRKAQALGETYVENSKQTAILLQRKEDFERALQKKKDEASSHVEVFTINAEFAGMAIGSRGSNIEVARQVEGVQEIRYDDGKKDYCTFKIVADTAESAAQARMVLEIMQETVFVPRNHVGKIIGKEGKVINDFVAKAGVAKVKIVDPEDGGDVLFEFIGTKEALETIRLMIQLQVKHLNEMEQIREELDAMNRELNPNSKPASRSESQSNFRQSQPNANRGNPANFNRRSAFTGQSNEPARVPSQSRKDRRQKDKK